MSIEFNNKNLSLKDIFFKDFVEESLEAKIKEKSTNATEEDNLLEGEGSGDETTTLATGLVDLQGGITEFFRPDFNKTQVLV